MPSGIGVKQQSTFTSAAFCSSRRTVFSTISTFIKIFLEQSNAMTVVFTAKKLGSSLISNFEPYCPFLCFKVKKISLHNFEILGSTQC